jgi:diacylglycerol kinase (ATP)
MRMDLGVATDAAGVERRFSCMAGMGFDAKVVRAVTPRLKDRLKGLAFPLIAFKVLLQEKFPPVRVSGGGANHVVPFAIVANAHRYGGDYRVSGPGLLTSGELEVICVRRVSLLLRPDIFASIMARRPLDRSMDSFCAREVRAESPGAEVPVQLDGEVWGSLPMSFRVEPGALEVIR